MARAVALAALEPKFWMAFCAGAASTRSSRRSCRGRTRQAIKQKLSALFLERTRDEWAAFGAEHDCCLEPVLEPHEVAGDAHLKERGAFFTMGSPWGAISQLRTPLTEPGATHSPPPRMGEHTDEILREAGIDDEGIAPASGGAGDRVGRWARRVCSGPRPFQFVILSASEGSPGRRELFSGSSS